MKFKMFHSTCSELSSSIANIIRLTGDSRRRYSGLTPTLGTDEDVRPSQSSSSLELNETGLAERMETVQGSRILEEIGTDRTNQLFFGLFHFAFWPFTMF